MAAAPSLPWLICYIATPQCPIAVHPCFLFPQSLLPVTNSMVLSTCRPNLSSTPRSHTCQSQVTRITRKKKEKKNTYRQVGRRWLLESTPGGERRWRPALACSRGLQWSSWASSIPRPYQKQKHIKHTRDTGQNAHTRNARATNTAANNTEYIDKNNTCLYYIWHEKHIGTK